ncbi:MAG: hypothetical protein ACLQU1_32155 [Bryobacteraceae bacterium]
MSPILLALALLTPAFRSRGITAQVSLPGKPARPVREIGSGRYEFEVKGIQP